MDAKTLATMLKVTKQKDQGKKEERQAFLSRVAEAISHDNFTSEMFAKLPADAQKWYEEVVEASKANADTVPDFAPAEKKEKAAAKPKLTLKAPAKGKAKEEPKAAAKGNEKAKPAKTAKPKKEKKVGRWDKVAKDKVGYRSMAEAVRHIVCKNKTVPAFEDVEKEIAARGFKGVNRSRVFDNYHHAKGTLTVLVELGKL